MFRDYSLILDLAMRKAASARSCVTEALDDLALFDPETELGKELTNAMVKVNQAGLLDQYVGYERVANKVMLHFDQEVARSKIDVLTQALSDGLQAKDGFAQPLIGVQYYKKPDPDHADDFTWIVEFTCSAPVDDEDGEAVPTAVDLEGDIETSAERKPGESEGENHEPSV